MKSDSTHDNYNDKIIKFPQKRRERKKNGPIFLVIVLILILLIALISSNGKAKFKSTNSVNTEVISLVNANNFDFAAYKDGYILAKDGKISCYNTNQSVQWEVDGSKTAPEVTSTGDFVLTYYTDDNVAVITNGKKTVEIKTPGNVQYGYVNSNGYCALLVDEFGLKNKIVVYNKKGEMIYYRDNPDKFITQIIFSDDNKTLVSGELVTSDSSISSSLVVTNVKSNKVISEIVFDNAVSGSCIFTDSKTILVVFDTCLRSYTTSGRMKWEKQFEGKSLHRYSYDNNVLACVFNTDDSVGTGSEVVLYNNRGRRVGDFEVKEKVRDIDLKDKNTLLTFDKKMVLTNFKGKEISEADITYDMKDSYFMGTKKCALVVSNSHDARLLPLE